DNELSWIHWDDADEPLIEFTAALARLRREHPTFRRSRFFDGRPIRREEGAPVPDIVWLRPDGTVMQPEDWDSGFGRAIGVFLNGQGIRERGRRGEPIEDLHFIVLFNAGDEAIDFHLPTHEFSPSWDVLVDTAGTQTDPGAVEPGGSLRLEAKSIIVLREHRGVAPTADHSVAASLAARGEPAGGRPGQACLRAPASTCRRQVRAGLDRDAAAHLTGYLRDLGADWAHLSPLLQATTGSDHGYDVVDPGRVDEQRGGPEAFARFVAAARAA